MRSKLPLYLVLMFLWVGAAWAADVQINTDESAGVRDPAVARQSTGEAFFVWTQGSIVGRRFNPMGRPIDLEPFEISTSSFGGDANPQVAMNDSGNVVVVWQEFSVDAGLEIFGRLYTFDDISNPSDVFQVNLNATGYQELPEVVMDAVGNFTVVFQGLSLTTEHVAVFMRRFDATGQPLGAEQEVQTPTTYSQIEPALAMGPSGEMAVSWVEVHGNPRLFLRLFDADGSPTSDTDQVLAGSTYNSLAISAQGNILIVTSGSTIFARLIDSMGIPQSHIFTLNEPDVVLGEPAVIARASGGFFVVWEQRQLGAHDDDLYGRVVQDDGTSPAPPFLVPATRPSDQGQPELAVQGDELLVTFRRLDSFGTGIFSTCFTAEGCTEVFLDSFELGNTSQWDSDFP